MFLQNSGQFAAQGKKCRESDVQQSFLRGKGVSPPVRIRSRTSFRSLQQASHRERISSVGCCRSGTMTVTAPEACPARTPLKLSSSTMLPDAPEQALDEYPMPDPMLTLDDLEKCGYRDGDMLPLQGAEVDWYIKAEDIVLKKGAAMNPQPPKKDAPPVK